MKSWTSGASFMWTPVFFINFHVPRRIVENALGRTG